MALFIGDIIVQMIYIIRLIRPHLDVIVLFLISGCFQLYKRICVGNLGFGSNKLRVRLTDYFMNRVRQNLYNARMSRNMYLLHVFTCVPDMIFFLDRVMHADPVLFLSVNKKEKR